MEANDLTSNKLSFLESDIKIIEHFEFEPQVYI